MLLQPLCIILLPLVNSNWSYSSETPNLGQIRRFLEPCDLEIWRMTLKNNRAPLPCCFHLCAWFHCHKWIQTGVSVWKRLSWVLTSVTLTFDFWPWPFAWTSHLSMVIIPENFMMIRWWEHGEKGVTDGWTDRRMDGRNQSYSCLVTANNVAKSWNFQESYLDTHLKPWCKVPKNPSGGNFYARWPPLPLDAYCYTIKSFNFLSIFHRKTILVCIPLFWNTRNTMELLFQH